MSWRLATASLFLALFAGPPPASARPFLEGPLAHPAVEEGWAEHQELMEQLGVLGDERMRRLKAEAGPAAMREIYLQILEKNAQRVATVRGMVRGVAARFHELYGERGFSEDAWKEHWGLIQYSDGGIKGRKDLERRLREMVLELREGMREPGPEVDLAIDLLNDVHNADISDQLEIIRGFEEWSERQGPPPRTPAPRPND